MYLYETLFLNASPPLSVRDWSFVLSAERGLISGGLADGACPATVQIDQRRLLTAHCQYCQNTLYCGFLARSDGPVQMNLIVFNCIVRILMSSDCITDQLQMVFAKDWWIELEQESLHKEPFLQINFHLKNIVPNVGMTIFFEYGYALLGLTLIKNW